MKQLHCVLFVVALVPVCAQVKLEADASGCADSKLVPKLLGCRIDNCEKKDSDRRIIAVKEDEKGEVVTTAIEGESRSIMYECQEGTTPGDVVQAATAALKSGSFEIPYQFRDKEGAVTGKKGDLWVLVDAASRYYTLVELKALQPDETATDAADMAEAIERNGHVAVYGIVFLPGKSDIAPESAVTLREVAAMIEDNPDWRICIDGHTDSTGTKVANISLSQRRATAVVAWLVGRGVKRTQLESTGSGDAHPVADNQTEAGRAKNRRIELVKMESAPAK